MAIQKLDADPTPEKLDALCSFRLRERAFLMDSTLLTSSALARIADRLQVKGATLLPWITQRIDLAIDELIAREQSESTPISDHLSDSFEVWMMGLGVNRHMIPRAARRFNGLPERIRQAYFLMVIDPNVLNELYPPGAEFPEELLEDTRTALESVLLYRPATGRNGEEGTAQ